MWRGVRACAQSYECACAGIIKLLSGTGASCARLRVTEWGVGTLWFVWVQWTLQCPFLQKTSQ